MLTKLPIVLALCAALSEAAPFAPVIERNVAVKMRDGVILRADIYRPKADGKFPVILQRTPYGKSQPLPFGLKAVEAGYVAIIQDCRGRYASEGDWYPFAHEFNDGYDTVEWAAELPFSNGKIGLYGGSYGGFTTLAGALSHPPHLAGFLSIEAGEGFYEGFLYRGGAFQQWLAESWTTTALAIDSLEKAARKTADVSRWARTLPPGSFPVLEPPNAKALAPYFFDWIKHPSYDQYWRQWAFEDRYAGVTAPGVHVGGWYDVFASGPPKVFSGIRSRAASREARDGQRLIMGPWSHGALFPKAGDLDFGPAVKVDLADFAFQWFDHFLRGSNNGVERQKPVRIFVMGENVWREEDEWPLKRARETRYYLHSDGKANSTRGTGVIRETPPERQPPDEYVYDPAEPVPTLGGGLCCGGIRAGAFDQRPNEDRADVLVYTTQPFEKDVEVTGPVRLELFVSSSAIDTDFTGTLVDVLPNGYAQNLTDGVLRARYRNSTEKAELLKPGEITKITINLGNTSNVFRTGHRLRIHISSSDFPRYDRNPNTGEEPAFATRMVKATNRIFHDAAHASALVLPVVPR
jgi:uncharacterized protein